MGQVTGQGVGQVIEQIMGQDLLRSASQHSDSSGFAEEPLTDCPSSLKLQESSDSCDSETTVTSRLSHDVATPLALEQPAFDRLVGAEEEEPDGCSTETEEHDGSSEEVLQYSVHQLPTEEPTRTGTRRRMEGLCGVSDASLVQQVLKQASSCHQGLAVPRERRLPLQRSSSLPSSFLSPTRVVSSMRIQFGSGGMAASTPPKYSYQYAYQEEEEEGEQTKCMSTLVIKPASSHTNDHSSCLNMDTFTPTIPKPIPRHLIPSSYCLPSPSPPPDGFGRLLGGYTRSWSTQSVPDLSSDQQQPGHLHQKQNTNQNNHSWSHLTNANANAIASPFPCPCPAQYPGPFQSYPSVPSLHQCYRYPSHPFPHHSSPGILYQPPAPTIPQHSGLTFLHQPTSTTIADQSYIHAQLPVGSYSHTPSPASSYHSYSPHHPPASALGLGLQPGLAHSPAPGGFQTPSSTEMQLRRVLHEVRGLVQSLAQNSADTPSDMLSEPRAALSISQLSLAELQHKRRSLNAFRSHMMDLELSIIRQQALVYTHMSPTDRLQVEQLQALRTAVRDELKDLEYQLEDRLQYTHAMGLHRGGSVDSLSAASALRAMEPVSDLLREQLHLQSELDYEGHTPSAGPSSRSSSPIRTNSGQKSEVYRASINITPAAPPRPITHTAERERFEQDEGGRDEGRRWVDQQQERAGAEGGAGDGVAIGNLQLLIQKIRESVVQEVRREIFNELMDVVSPQRSHSVTTEQPL
ncbi:protein ITPRID2-like [Lampris incognitus]|uniref:protein ITPRID2-like n=1 Tax=Lampris incognitus TaxID=2546036 RepID=UPI0024B52249|nr:protein ITPRID2-like [Lampris incognitus]